MYSDITINYTVESVNSKTAVVKTTGHKNMCFTIVLVCMADGTQLHLIVIFKCKTLPKENLTLGMVVHVHVGGWMDKGGASLAAESVMQNLFKSLMYLIHYVIFLLNIKAYYNCFMFLNYLILLCMIT